MKKVDIDEIARALYIAHLTRKPIPGGEANIREHAIKVARGSMALAEIYEHEHNKKYPHN
jgi:hypothetical protein